MKIFFMGLHYTSEEEDYLYKVCSGRISVAHKKLQDNLINGLRENNAELFEIAALPIGSFPFLSHVIKTKTKRDGFRTETGYINIPLIKDETLFRGAYKELKNKLATVRSEEHIYIIVYDMCIPFIKAALKMREKDKRCKCVLIIPDLPGEFGIFQASGGAFVKLRLGQKEKAYFSCVGKFDGYLPITKHVMHAIKQSDKPYMVVEGIADVSDISDFREGKPYKKIFMYAGELSVNVGIDVLLNAFEKIEGNKYELWICGKGERESTVKEKVKVDKRIKYLGFVKSNEMKKLQNEVDVFVNPRQNEFKYTGYSFPSKNIEYLKTGKPLVGYKLDGIPDEYDEFMFYPENNSPSALAKAMMQAANLTETELRSVYARQTAFLKENKSSKKQGEAIKKFLCQL